MEKEVEKFIKDMDTAEDWLYAEENLKKWRSEGGHIVFLTDESEIPENVLQYAMKHNEDADWWAKRLELINKISK